MADIEPPSFSLGLDLDLDLDFGPSRPDPLQNPPTHVNSAPIQPDPKGKQKVKQIEDDAEFQWQVSDSEPESPEHSSLTRLRRLRRGGPKPISTPVLSSVDDDIEEFSDEGNAPKNDLLAPLHYSSCSSSKLPLSGYGVLKRQQESAIHNRKSKQESSCPSTSLGSSKGKTVFSDLTASPLRRFQLLDSESDPDDPSDVHIEREAIEVDFSKNNKQKEYNIRARFKLLDSESDPEDPSDTECIGRESSGVDFSKNIKQKDSNHESHKMSLGNITNLFPPISQKQDLWKDFCVSDKHPVQTPAFDEFCKEYCQTVNSRKPVPGSHKLCSSNLESSKDNSKRILQLQDSGAVVPPSHRYFFHNDLRIQRLVRSRLPHFCPLTSGDAGSKSHNVSSIDYMSQFCQDGGNQQTSRQVNLNKNCKRGRKKSKNFSMEETSLGSEDWINPKQTASTPKDAGRRRVHANGQSAGHWITAENGRKVYVTKNGQQLTGSVAYKHYRKESGSSSKLKKKRAAKKK